MKALVIRAILSEQVEHSGAESPERSWSVEVGMRHCTGYAWCDECAQWRGKGRV